MPNFDGTGPQGYGPLTGRGFGPCNGGAGRGFGRGFGRGYGRALGIKWASRQMQLEPVDEKKLLQEELEAMEKEKKEIEKRLKELKA